MLSASLWEDADLSKAALASYFLFTVAGILCQLCPCFWRMIWDIFAGAAEDDAEDLMAMPTETRSWTSTCLPVILSGLVARSL